MLGDNEKNKGYFGEGWDGKDWGWFIFWGLIFIVISTVLRELLGIPKNWTLAIILIPVAVWGYFYNKKKSGQGK